MSSFEMKPEQIMAWYVDGVVSQFHFWGISIDFGKIYPKKLTIKISKNKKYEFEWNQPHTSSYFLCNVYRIRK